MDYPINNSLGVSHSNSNMNFSNSFEVYTDFSSDLDLTSLKPKAVEVTSGFGSSLVVVDINDNEKTITVPYDGYVVKAFIKTIKSTSTVSEVVVYYDVM